MRRSKSLLQHLWDAVGSPLRMALLPDRWAERLGFTSLEGERLAAVLPEVRGELLDVGAGNNRLVREYGRGVGVDVHDWGGGVRVIRDAAALPFEDASFDTVSFVASLNHIANRRAALREAVRVLRPGGRVVATMIDPVLGAIVHRVVWHDEHRHRAVDPGELGGLWPRHLIEMLEEAGLELVLRRRFLYRLNNLFVAVKPAGSGAGDPRPVEAERALL